MKNTKIESEVVLDRIVGARLTSVDFVLNYLSLGFDNKGALTTLVWPEISAAGQVLKFGMQGYRDGLCELIAQVVSEVNFSDDETITISIGEHQLRIPLRQREHQGERAIFNGPKHVLRVW